MQRLRIKRTILRVAMTLVVMLFTTASAWAQTPSGYWSEWVNDNNIDWSSAEAKAAAIPQSDDGSTVYISTAEQLAYYAYAVNNNKETSGSASGYYCGRTVELMADIDLSAHYWKPIGWNKNYYFNGYFHGNGHVITGVHVNGDPKSDDTYKYPCYGLFGYLSYRNSGTSTITDLVLKDFSITASYSGNNSDAFYIGGLVGRCDDNTAITNCLLVNGSVGKNTRNTWAHIGKVAGGGSPSTATANYYHNVSVSGWTSEFAEKYSQQTIGGETEARAVALTISGTHGSVALGGTVGRISDGIIYAPANETVTLNTTADAGYIASLAATGISLTSGQFTMPDNDDATITATVSIDPAQFSQDGDTYTINTAGGWNVFCDLLADNAKGYFSGKTVALDADITVTRMAGGEYHDFTGTFDGGGHTLTFSHTATDNYCAPFRHVQGASAETPAVIRNLNVVSTVTAADYRHPAGLIALQSGYVSVTDCNVEAHINCTKGAVNTSDLYPAALVSQSNNTGVLTVSGCTTTGQIATDGKYAAGLVGIVQNTATIENCRVSVTIQSTTSGDGTHGGLVASQSSKTTITIEGCVFDGSLLGSKTNKCGGFIGWRGNTATITNSLFAPTEVTVQNDNSATFARNKVDTYNCYYTYYLCDGTNYAPYDPADAEHPDKYNNGHATRTVAAGADVTIEAVDITSGAEWYNVSGILAYSSGGLYRDANLYYGSGDQLSLTLSNTAPAAPLGYQYGYTASAGTLSGSTLTMPDQDVTISVNTADLAPIDWATVNQGTSKDPYMIYNKDQLLLLAHRVNGTNGETANTYEGKYFKLGADITFTHPADEDDDYAENYEAIGGYAGGTYRNFKGKFDGANHTVSGIRTRKTGSDEANSNQGLFGCISSGADIHDVHLTDARITGYDCVGGIAGLNVDGYIMRCSVTDSYITATRNRYYGTICGSATNTNRLSNNYYHGCTVNSTAVTSGVGCQRADLAANHGALPAYRLALGANITTPPGTFASQTEWLTTPPVDPRLAPENGFTLAGNHYFVSGYVFTPGSTLASGAAQGYTPRATLGGQLLDLYTPTGDDDALAGTAIAQFTVTADCEGKTLASTQAIYSTGQPVTVAYVDANGEGHNADAIALDGTETSLGTNGKEKWYFAGLPEVNFDHTVTLNGNVHIILSDGKTMNVGTSSERIDAYGIIRGTAPTLSIYGQTLGTGALNVYTTGINHNAICSNAITINGGHVTANADGQYTSGLWAYLSDVAINGGKVEASGTRYGIVADGTITLGWTKPTDRITASSYSGTVQVADGKKLTDGSGNILTGTLTADDIDGKTLSPCLALADDADNSGVISEWNGSLIDAVTLTRTYSSTATNWNTFCVPFDIDNTTLKAKFGNDVEVAEYSEESTDANNITVSFTKMTEPAITANKPVLLRASAVPATVTFTGVTIKNAEPKVAGNYFDFVGSYEAQKYVETGNYYLSANKLYRSSKDNGTYIKGLRAYIKAKTANARVAKFGINEDVVTEVNEVKGVKEVNDDSWYTVDGVKLDKQPTKKGMYIYNGRKTVIK